MVGCEITSRAFEEAWQDEKNLNFIKFALKRYRGRLDRSILKSVGQLGLFHALRNHDDSYETSLTTSILRWVQWACQDEIRINKRRYHELNIDVPASEQKDLSWLHEILAKLNNEELQYIHDYFFEELTLYEIGHKYGFSHQTAKRRIDAVLDKLRILCG